MDMALADRGRRLSRGWFVLFCLSSMWVYSIRASAAFLYIWSGLADHFQAVGFFSYPVQILGACVLPWWLDRRGIASQPRVGARLFAALMAASLVLLGCTPFVSGFAAPLAMHYLLILLTATAMGLALRRGAMLWDPNRVALYVGGAYILYYVADDIQYYSWFGTYNMALFMGCAFGIFAGLLIAALIVRLRLRDDFALSMPEVARPYPRPLVRGAVIVLALHALFSVLINTVWYFENDGAFPSFAYEIAFKLAALLVMGAGTWLLYQRRWFVTALGCLLVLCLVQGLTLFGIENMPLAVGYNLATMAAKMPIYLLSLILPTWYAAARRAPGLACLGFGMNSAIEFLVMLTQLRPGTLGAIPRQGALLLIGLALIGLVVWLYIRFQKIQTDDLLSSIRASQHERKTPAQALAALNLTPREHEVAGLLLAGDSQKIIAAKLKISGATVGFHTKNLYRKLNIQSRAELFALFMGSALEEAGM